MKFRIALIAAALASLSLAACSSEDNPAGPPAGSLELNSGNIPSGQSFTHRFFSANAYGYHCTIHGGMTGTVTVNDAATDTSVVVDIDNNAFSPAAVTVKTGGKVVWNNSDNTTHTVTSH